MSNDELLYNGRVVRHELDHLIAQLELMRRLATTSLKAAQEQREKVENYFHLSPEFSSTHIYDELLRLANTPPGAMVARDVHTLERIYELVEGEYIRINGRLATLVKHNRFPHIPAGGWLTFRFERETVERPLDYEDAWSLVTNGTLTFGKD